MEIDAPENINVLLAAVEQCFNCGPGTYKPYGLHRPGIQIVLDGHWYCVETLADREKICASTLENIDYSGSLPYALKIEAVEGLEKHEAFFPTLLKVIAETDGGSLDYTSNVAAQRANLALALGIHQLTGKNLWTAIAEVDKSLLTAAVLTAGRLDREEYLDEVGQVSRKMAALYFEVGELLLCQVENGFFKEVLISETPVAIYEVYPSQ